MALLIPKRKQSDGGEIRITVRGNIILLKESQITTAAGINGGNIIINSDELIHLINSEITAQSGNNGGNIIFRKQCDDT